MPGFKIDMILGRVREKDTASFSGSTYPKLFTGTGNPNGVQTASKAGDEYYDSASGLKYFSQAADDSHWVEINFTN